MSTDPAPKSFRDPGAWFLLIPLLTLVAGILWSRGRLGGSGEHAAPPPLDDLRPVSGWSGRHELADGTRLVLRLTPLNASLRHQSFDTAVLGPLLGESDGEPWRLFLARGPGEAGPMESPLDLQDLFAVTDQGELHPPAAEPGGDRPMDPVRVLLAAPSSPLGPGEEVSLVLWGMAPTESVRIVVGEEAIELHPDEVPRSAVQRALAHRDPPFTSTESR